MLDRFALNIGVTTNFLVLLFSDYLKDFVIKGHKEIKQQQVFAIHQYSSTTILLLVTCRSYSLVENRKPSSFPSLPGPKQCFVSWKKEIKDLASKRDMNRNKDRSIYPKRIDFVQRARFAP
jgi:hypothetical protein